MKLNQLNSHCWEEVYKYQNLNIFGTSVCTPYFMNNVENYFISLMKEVEVEEDKIDLLKTKYRNKEVPYGWYRGKGTPKEIEEATINISQQVGLLLENSNSESILDFMKLYALGVDCSGFIYNVLDFSLKKEGYLNLLNETLDWDSSINKSVNRAGAFTFAGNASTIVKPNRVQALDLLLIKSPKSNKYIHIAMLLENKNNMFDVVQSTISKFPSGVRSDGLSVSGDTVKFDFVPEIGEAKHSWEKLYVNGFLEFRRLNIFR